MIYSHYSNYYICKCLYIYLLNPDHWNTHWNSNPKYNCEIKFAVNKNYALIVIGNKSGDVSDHPHYFHMAYMELYSHCEKHNYFGARIVMELLSVSLLYLKTTLRNTLC